jgi:hypothetical protein
MWYGKRRSHNFPLTSMDVLCRSSLRNRHHLRLDKLAFRATNPISGQHSDGMRSVRGLRKVITRCVQNVLEGFGIGNHEPILLEEPQW